MSHDHTKEEECKYEIAISFGSHAIKQTDWFSTPNGNSFLLFQCITNHAILRIENKKPKFNYEIEFRGKEDKLVTLFFRTRNKEINNIIKSADAKISLPLFDMELLGIDNEIKRLLFIKRDDDWVLLYILKNQPFFLLIFNGNFFEITEDSKNLSTSKQHSLKKLQEQISSLQKGNFTKVNIDEIFYYASDIFKEPVEVTH